ncbi:MAG: TolC family protein [Thermodesulfovibrionales bacterium]
MGRLAACALLSLLPLAQARAETYTLAEAVHYALAHNPGLAASGKVVEMEGYSVMEARGERLPRVDITGGLIHSRYALPVTPISGPPTAQGFPEFDDTLYDAGVTLTLPLYRGGRLARGVSIAEAGKSVAEDLFALGRQELAFNVASAYFKVLQLEKTLLSSEETVRQLEAHRRNVELHLEAGSVPRVDLLRTETELAHARQNAIAVRNSLQSARELLKALMGFEDLGREISLVPESLAAASPGLARTGLEDALARRPDYQAALKETAMAAEGVRLAEGRRLPSLDIVGEFSEKTGADYFEPRENWLMGVRLTLPVFDGGVIRSQVGRQKKALERAGEVERSLRLRIAREVRDARREMENASERIGVAEKALGAARESLRIELLRFDAGEGTSTDVMDAQAALLRAETEYYQGLYDREIAMASLIKAVGLEIYREE